MQVTLEKNVYSKTAILRVAYQFLDSVYIHISQTESSWIIEWTSKDESNPIDARAFENEAVAQQLRQTLLEDTSDIRRIVLARAYASTVVDDAIPAELPHSEQQYYSAESFDTDDVLRGWYDSDGSCDL